MFENKIICGENGPKLNLKTEMLRIYLFIVNIKGISVNFFYL